MIRVHKTTFCTSKADLDRLFACNRVSAGVWNDCLEIARAYHQQHGKWIGKSDLQKATKGKYPIHSQSVQAVCHKYLWARDNAKSAKSQGYVHHRYPYRQKKISPRSGLRRVLSFMRMGGLSSVWVFIKGSARSPLWFTSPGYRPVG